MHKFWGRFLTPPQKRKTFCGHPASRTRASRNCQHLSRCFCRFFNLQITYIPECFANWLHNGADVLRLVFDFFPFSFGNAWEEKRSSILYPKWPCEVSPTDLIKSYTTRRARIAFAATSRTRVLHYQGQSIGLFAAF